MRMCRRLGIGPVRDLGLLGSALERPRTSLFGEDAYPQLEMKAAAMLESIVRNHPLVDGNKRLGWACLIVFLDLNGHWLEVDDDEAFDLVMGIAAGEVPLGAIANAIGGWSADGPSSQRRSIAPESTKARRASRT